MGYAVGLDKFPGLFTFIGAIITLYGIKQIDNGSKNNEKKIPEDETKISMENGIDDEETTST